MTLYQIDKQITDCMDMETGEVLDIEKLEQLHMDRDQKEENIALAYKNKIADLNALTTERKALQEREKQATAQLERIKQYLVMALDGRTLNTPRVACSYRKSETLEITDTTNIPTEYWKQTPPEVDKAGLKLAVKNGLRIDGVTIAVNQNIQIK